MPGPEAYSYPSPLEGYEGLPALPEYTLHAYHDGMRQALANAIYREKNTDGKSFINPPAASLSPAYSSFISPN